MTAPDHASSTNASSTSAAALKDRSLDVDVIQARIDVQTSKARSLVASWLPTNKTLTVAHPGSDDDDEELFKPAPPTLGVGAPIPANFNPKSHGSTDALRRAMLGGRKPTKAMPQWEKQQQRKVVAPDDSDEDTGRSALGGTKRKRSVGNDLRKTKIAKSEIPRERPASDKAELRSEPPQAVVEVDNSISKKKKKNKKRQQLIE